MRQQAMGERMVFNRPMPVNRLVSAIADSKSPFPSFLLFWVITHEEQRRKPTPKNTVGDHTV